MVNEPPAWRWSSFLSDDVVVARMNESIDEARASVAEDDRPHPLVGALLVSTEGRVLLRSHRDAGRHAEFNLLEA
jgi:pyrimidine deaminase RibD-like protein